MLNAGIPLRPTAFDGRGRLKALRMSETKVYGIDRESDDRKSAEKLCMQSLLKKLLTFS
jgi:hypothetical protein